MLLKIVDSGVFRDILIREGDMFLLPSNTPHNTVRFANTIGLVLEQRRPQDTIDRLRWYCANCGCVVYEAAFHLTDLGTELRTVIEELRDDNEKRTCHECGEMVDTAPNLASIKDPNLE
jgi:3-hydroxyanthranilate 3,4-dioxygenase